MFKKIAIGLLVFVAVAGTLIWMNRATILTHIVLNRAEAAKEFIAPNQPITWQAGPSEPRASDESRPPNIVFILLDDFGYNDLSTFGGGVADGKVPTPNIDRLAAEGAVFSQAYSGTGTCAPSRAMLMTGRYPTRTGISTIANGRSRPHVPQVTPNRDIGEGALPFEQQGLPTSEVTIAELLQEHDYHTVHIGKWHLGRQPEYLPNVQGFDESLMMHSGLFLNEDSPDVVNAKLDFDPIDKFLWARMQYAASFNGSAPFEPGGYLTDWWTDESLRVIEANKNHPFFLYLAHWAPHTPLQATQADYDAVGDIEPHRERVYAAMIHALDRSVGRVMEKLEAEGLAENTIIVLSSDNGGAGYIGLPEVNAPFRGWKITLFEGGIRVPLFVKWPAKITPGTVVDTPVAHIDLFPTLAAAAGASLPTDLVIDGQNILPEATGDGAIERPNDAIYWSSGTYKVVRAADWKLQVDEQQDKTWLFNLAEDPTEQSDLADARPDKVAELKSLLADHYADAVEPLYPHKITSPILIDKTVDQTPTAQDEYVIWPN